ncbi:MAG: glycosyltransferase [Bacteroidetes bacterium HGW-Bacteroidetes-17]|jgi:dolichol-phosphate mannosyltransferase|nr:MAG: glycosyltransferase [Bacteroidetes bacterium HGW-Bacteroidetes-17]
MKIIDLSVVIPLYKCSKAIEELTGRLITTLEAITTSFEIIYINDASPENDWEIVKIQATKDQRIKGINFSRNFGQHYAITAGLEHAKGNWIIVMDGDLQDQPEDILKLYEKANEGNDMVLGMRIGRKDSGLKIIFSKLFYKLFSYLTDTKQDATIANFGIYHRKVIDAILSMKDSIRYFPTMVQWVGFRKAKIAINHTERVYGQSAYSFKSLINLAFNNIIAFSDKPLRLTVKFGFSLTILSIIYGSTILIKYLTGHISVAGYASLLVSIWFLSGLIIAILGMVGIYVGKTFEGVKKRPYYIIKKII